MDADRNLLFGVLALQADAVSKSHFLEACALWASEKDKPLADHLTQRGWISAEDRSNIERILDRKLQRHGGDARASLIEATTDGVRNLIEKQAVPEVQRSLFGVVPAGGSVAISTVAFTPEKDGRYTRTRLHAEGGMGQVWLARDASVGRDVALKELRPDRVDQTQLWARFVTEARLTGQLEHPGIVPIYEIGRNSSAQPFYTMRFVRGRTLSEATSHYHDRRQRGESTTLELRELLAAFAAVCNAVAFAHSRGVIHRDLKPQNVVLGDFGEVMVLDWGLAKSIAGNDESEANEDFKFAVDGSSDATASDATQQGQILGTPAYMAPEQADGMLDQLTARTDVYGLGAILYEILTGRIPFDGKSTLEVLQKVRHEPPTPPRSVQPTCAAALEAVCLKAMSKKPDDRYDSAKDLAMEVDRWLADEPVQAYSEPFTARAGRWARRHRTFVAGATAFLFVAAVASTLAVVFIGRKNVEIAASRQEARANFRKARDAVDKMLSRVGDLQLREIPMMEKLRRDLLEEALQFNRDFVQTHGDDPEVRYETALAHGRLGKIYQQLRQDGAADAAHLQSIAMLEKLAEEFPKQPLYRRDLSAGHAFRGRLPLKQADVVESWNKAIGLQRALIDEHPDDLDFRNGLGSSLVGVALAYRAASNHEEAEAASREALDVFRRLAESDPKREEFRLGLSNAHHNLAILLEERGNFADAGPQFEQCVEVAERLATDKAENRFFVATHRRALGVHYARTKRVDKSNELFKKAIDDYERLAMEFPNTPDYQHVLATSYSDMAVSKARAGKILEAEPYFRKVLEQRTKIAATFPQVPDFRRNLGFAQQQLGQVLLDKKQPKDAVELLNQAQATRRRMMNDSPKIIDYKFDYSVGESLLAIALNAAGSAKEAEEHFRAAIKIGSEIATEKKTAPDFQHKLALSRRQFADSLKGTGRNKEAEAEYREAIAVWEKLVIASPKVTDYQRQLNSARDALEDMLHPDDGKNKKTSERPKRAPRNN